MAELNRQPVWKEFPVSSSADVLIVRRAVHELATRLDFTEKRCAEIVLAVSELAQNHVSFGTQNGMILVSGLFLGTCSMITIFSTDQGPGIHDLPLALSDGFTSGESYGNGLGAVSRLADDFAICSGSSGKMPCSQGLLKGDGRGTLVAASFFSSDREVSLGKGLSLSALVAPKGDEKFSGDGLYLRCKGDFTLVVVADVLGHGREAAESISIMWELLDVLDPSSPLEQAVCVLDRGFGGRRGFAGLFMNINTASAKMSACGVGNIRAILHNGKKQIALTSLPGVIGQSINCRRLMMQELSIEPGTSCIVFSDGIDGSRLDTCFNNDLSPLFNSYLAFATALSQEDDALVVSWKWQKS